jgi:hypothetical protein
MSETKKIGYVSQFAATLSTDGMSVTVNFDMPEGATKADFAAKLDMLRHVVERQRAKGEIPLLESMIAEKEAALRNQRIDLLQYLKRPNTSASDETAERTKARIEEMEADIKRGKLQLEATRAKAI